MRKFIPYIIIVLLAGIALFSIRLQATRMSVSSWYEGCMEAALALNNVGAEKDAYFVALVCKQRNHQIKQEFGLEEK